MVEPTTFIAAAGLALKLKELTPLLTALRNSAPREVRDQIDAVSDKFFEIRTDVVEAGEREAALRERCRTLEGELQRLKDWAAEEKNRYALKSLDGGATVYAPTPEFAAEGAPHWLCAGCFTNSRKSHLQPQGQVKTGHAKWGCPQCHATFVTHWLNRPGP